jgi:alanine dehydrogenase
MKIGQDILWLSEGDVKSLLSMEEVLPLVEQAFLLHGQKKVQMPVKIYLNFDPFGGDLRAMPAYLKNPVNAAGVKIVNSNAKNPERGLPAVAGIVVYVDPQTGLPLGVFAAGTLTALRTGAGGGIAARYLARKNSATVGLVGCGRQADTQLQALLQNFSIKKVFVWGKTIEESQQFCRQNSSSGYELVACAQVEDVCSADIVVTTTPSTKPLVKASWIKPGTHINAIGADAPGKQELETGVLKKSRVVVDDWHQSSHAGEINVSVTKKKFGQKDLAGELGQIIAGKKKGRLRESDITLFDSTGLAIQDISVAKYLFEKAQKLNKGQVLKLYG